jgi:hypothetical protein
MEASRCCRLRRELRYIAMALGLTILSALLPRANLLIE